MNTVKQLFDLLAWLWYAYPILHFIAILVIGYNVVKMLFLLVLWKDIKEEAAACARRDANLK